MNVKLLRLNVMRDIYEFYFMRDLHYVFYPSFLYLSQYIYIYTRKIDILICICIKKGTYYYAYIGKNHVCISEDNALELNQ